MTLYEYKIQNTKNSWGGGGGGGGGCKGGVGALGYNNKE